MRVVILLLVTAVGCLGADILAEAGVLQFLQEMLAAVPAYKLFLDTLPLPNQPYAPGADTGFYQGAGSLKSSDNHMVIKPDVRISDTMTASMTYTRDRPRRLIPRASAVNFRSFAGETDRYTANFTVAHARWTSETRYGYNRNRVNRLDGFYNVQDPNKTEASPGGRRLSGISALGFSNCEINTLGAPGQSIEEKIAITGGPAFAQIRWSLLP